MKIKESLMKKLKQTKKDKLEKCDENKKKNFTGR